MTEELGTVRAEGESATLRFERTYDATPEEVWAAFTEPDSIRRWLFAEAVLEQRVGGTFRLVWSESERAGGSVLAWDPPHALEVEWIEGGVRSVLRVEIAPSRAGTLLVLDHRDLALDAAVGTGAGWHAHLEALGDILAGRHVTAEKWRPRYEILRERYAEVASTT